MICIGFGFVPNKITICPFFKLHVMIFMCMFYHFIKLTRTPST